MVRLGPDRFVKRLSSLYEEHKDHGTVWVTMKRIGEGKKHPDSGCLIRATDGKRKISCFIASSSKVTEFEPQLHAIMKAHFLGGVKTPQVVLATRTLSSSC
jgi:hypothetical protein